MGYVIFYMIIGMLLPFALSGKKQVDGNKVSFLGYKWTFPITISLIIIILIRAFAYDTAADYLVYYDNYRYNGNTYWGENREVGYNILNSLLYNISSSPQFFFGFYAFIYMYSILMVSQLFGKADKWIVYFWSIILFVLSYNLYRQYYSLSFILLAYYWFVKKSYTKVCVFCVLAVLFHTSAILGIAIVGSIYLLRKKVINKNYLLIAMVLTSIFSTTILSSFLNSLSFISEWYVQETGKSYTTENMLDTMHARSVLTYPSMLAYLTFIWFGDKMVKEMPTYRFLFYLFSFAVIINPITNQEILMRIRLYVDAFIPLFLGVLAHRYNRVYQYPMLWLAFIFLIAKFAYGLYHLGTVHPLQFKF